MSDEATRDETELTPEEGSRPEVGDETPLETAQRERTEYLANWQRARADYQNLRRRTHEDIQAAVRRERATFLDESLVVLDYLDLALAAPAEGDEAKNLLVGVKMTRDQLWTMLERQGIAPIETGGIFDIERHQAVATVETEAHTPGEIVEVVRRGFSLGDSVLRYAQVKVAAAPGESDIEKSGGEMADEGS